jgi:hypothetical protein
MHPIQFHSLGVIGKKGIVTRHLHLSEHTEEERHEKCLHIEFTAGFMYMTTLENNTYSCNILIKTKSSLLLFTFNKLE